MTEIPQQQLPEDALRRLKEAEGPGGKRLFTSDLSVNEFLLVKEAGFHPARSGDGQLDLPHRHPDPALEPEPGARQADPGHVQRPRAGHDPDGGGGRRARAPTASWASGSTSTTTSGGSDAAEFIAVGTAVKAKDGAPAATPKASPSRRDLSGQDFWTLLHAGYAPLGLVLGTCVYHVAHRTLSAPWALPAGPPSCPISPRPCTTPASWP